MLRLVSYPLYNYTIYESRLKKKWKVYMNQGQRKRQSANGVNFNLNEKLSFLRLHGIMVSIAFAGQFDMDWNSLSWWNKIYCDILECFIKNINKEVIFNLSRQCLKLCFMINFKAQVWWLFVISIWPYSKNYCSFSLLSLLMPTFWF